MNPEPKKPKPASQVSAVYFRESAVICGAECLSASVPAKGFAGHRPGNSVERIELCWLRPDGAPGDPAERTSDGLLFRKRSTDRTSGAPIIAQSFVPWSSVRCVDYVAEGA